VVSSSSISRLRDFTPTGARAAVPTLILPPQAGHHSCIVDFSPRQSQVAIAIEAGLDRVFALEWLEATAETRHASIASYVAAVRAAIAEIGGPVNLIGDCQGGWLAALYAALEPQDVATLTVGGAPIDFHAGEAAIALYVGLVGSYDGIAPYRALVDAGGGLLRGELMLGGFVALRPEAELRKQLELLLHLDDPEFVRRYVEFEDWFKHTQDIAGEFYLWIVDRLFLRNELIHGTLTVEDRVVDLAAITCPTTIIAGTRDHITPPPQAFALAAHVATPAADIVTDVVDAGHLGLFMGRAALRGHWLPHLHRIAAAQDAAR
jgi:poly(3-hydroxyalkanoate) synthetase